MMEARQLHAKPPVFCVIRAVPCLQSSANTCMDTDYLPLRPARGGSYRRPSRYGISLLPHITLLHKVDHRTNMTIIVPETASLAVRKHVYF